MILNPLKLVRVSWKRIDHEFDTKDGEALSMICDGCEWSEKCGPVGDIDDRWCLYWLIRARKVKKDG